MGFPPVEIDGSKAGEAAKGQLELVANIKVVRTTNLRRNWVTCQQMTPQAPLTFQKPS